MRKIIYAIISTLAAFGICSAATVTGRFRPIDLPTGKITSVFSIEQTPTGFVWMGTDDGLLRYDGYGYKTYRWAMDDSSSIANNIINALEYCEDDGLLYVGTDTGVSIYDPLKDSFTTMPGTGGRHVKSFLVRNDGIFICTTTELLLYKDGIAVPVIKGHFTNVREHDDCMWAASYNAIYRITDGLDIERHDLSSFLPAKNTLVLDVCRDMNDGDALWVGSEDGMFLYYPAEARSGRSRFAKTPIKTFRYIGDELWIGSDNGLIILEEGEEPVVYQHVAGRTSSLPNNVVWSVFEDASGDVWIGTDHGVAIVGKGDSYRFVGLDEMTDAGDGLDISVMEVDRSGNLWLGGPNGLICSDAGLNAELWLKADSENTHERLSHNKVRDLHDDGEIMWIVSDGGLDAYVHKTGQVRKCIVNEPTGCFSSNWMYSIAEDPEGRLWIGTYDGGLYAISKDKALSGTGDVMSDIHLSTESVPSLTSNIVRHVAVRDNVLYAETYNTINIISLDTWETSRVRIPHDTFVVSILPADDGLYVGTDKGLYLMDSEGGLEKMSEPDIYVMSMTFCDGLLWIAGKASIYSYCPETEVWHHLPLNDMPLMSVQSYGNSICFGTVDGVVMYSPEDASREQPDRRITLTGLYVNEELVRAGAEYDGHIIIGKNITSADRITLTHRQNSFSFSMSSFTYGKADDSMTYRLKGFDDRWRKIPAGSNTVSFINVPAGDYVFEYACADSGSASGGAISSIDLEITPVWYLTTGAYIIYFLFFAGFCIAAFYYWKMRHMLSMEHAERERAIAMADSKTEFLSDISHEFKSPLSIILNYISRMTASESDVLRSRELQTVQKNAEKMHLLLNQMLEFNENGAQSLFMPTAVSLGAMAKEVWARYAGAFADKQISARFVSDEIGYIFMVDKVQMESVFQNLLSNALKFTPSGGSILMSVTISEETSDMVYVDIKVEDSGCGIAESELPKIFNRYYMAPSGQRLNSGGSGIGLNIVRSIVERHKGKIWVESEIGKGSCFTIRLSTLKSESFILKSAIDIEESLHNLSQVWQHERKPIILIVEDNQDIRDFIIASLGKDYVFLTATNGHVALELLKSEKVDLVITDIAMPEMDGLAMSRMIRNNLETAFLPIIILTGKNDMQTQIQSFEYADAFISKPFDLNYLNGRIIKLLIKHEQYLSKIRQKKMLLPEAEELDSPDEKFLSEIIRIVNKNIADADFSVATLCRESHWSDKQVYRKIKQLTGKTVSEFIREIRLEKAAAYLLQGKLTINEVMYKVGFTTASYFSKCFKEKYGVTPTEYRE